MSRRWMACALLSLLVGCGQPGPPTAATPGPNPGIPGDVAYTITEDWEDLDATSKRRSVDVRLNRKVSAAVLRAIALEIKSGEDRPHERTSIYYYLPMFDSAAIKAPWATTHFDPTPEVKINGSTIEQERAVRKVPIDRKRVLFGPWFRELDSGSLDYLTRDAGDLMLVHRDAEGREQKSEIVEFPALVGRRFKLKNGSNIYEIDDRGDLRIYSADGKIIEASPQIR